METRFKHSKVSLNYFDEFLLRSEYFCAMLTSGWLESKEENHLNLSMKVKTRIFQEMINNEKNCKIV